MKILSSCIILVLTLLFAGCGNQPEPVYITKIEKVEVVVPTNKCEIPKVSCDFSGKNFEPTKKLLDCVGLQKKYIDACRYEPK